MKDLRRLTTKIAGGALAIVMMFGGAAVFAAENGDQVYSSRLECTAYRDFFWEFFDYHTCSRTMTVPETGIYTITISVNNPGDYYKDVRIHDENGRYPLNVQGCWESATLTYTGIDLEKGMIYNVVAYAEDYMGVTMSTDGSVTFTVTATLESKGNSGEETVSRPLEDPEILRTPTTLNPHQDPQIPQNPTMPQIVIDDEPESDDNFNMYVDLNGTDEGTQIPSMPQIIIDAEPESDDHFNMYVDLDGEDEGTQIPSMPQIVINAEPEEPTAPTTFTMYVTATPVNPVIDNTIVDDTTDENTTVENTATVNPVITNTAIEATDIPVFTLTAEQIRVLAIRNFVGHLYIDGLGRRATEAEIDEWADKLMCDSITATEAASQILTSSELNGHNFDNEQIAAILDEVFDTDSESDTLAQLNNGASVASVIEQLADTDNWASKCAFYGVNV